MSRQQLVTAPNPGNSGSIGAVRGGAMVDWDAVDPFIGASPNQVREEIDDAFEDMGQFHTMEPDEIMRRAAGHSARLSYLRVRCLRREDYARHWKDVRQRELEPCIDELRKQWEHGSRLHTVREFDYKVETGER